MAAPRSRAQTLETPPNSKQTQRKMNGYEQTREERIKENLERMQKLGIFDLSLKLKSVKPRLNNNLSNRKTPQNRPSPQPSPGPVRRSSRLQNTTPVQYCEVRAKKDADLETDTELIEEGSKPEIYTDKHEKLLGTTDLSWILFVDGCGKDGKRIYDPVNGKTCHQCRQKTLGHRTHCSKCNLVQGQFCGDCLYMRYGEHVLEAKQNPNWVCPPCRGICNCSLCRKAKGWPPTGYLYRKISSLGYKSVAHYLIQTRRAKTDLEEDSGRDVPVTMKKSLLFIDTDEMSREKLMPLSKGDCQGLNQPETGSEDKKNIDGFKGDKVRVEGHLLEDKHNDTDAGLERSLEELGLVMESSDDHRGLASEDNKACSDFKFGREKFHTLNDEYITSDILPESSLEPEEELALAKIPYVNNCHVPSEPESDQHKENVGEEEETHSLEIGCGNSKINVTDTNNPSLWSRPESQDRDELDNKNCEDITSSENSPEPKKKQVCAIELDSVAGRLKQRRAKRYRNDGLGQIATRMDVESISNSNIHSPNIDSIAARLKLRQRRA